MYRLDLLLGVTENGELIFGNIDVRNRSGIEGDLEFTASFDTVFPTVLSSDLALDRIENYIECLDSDSIVELLKTHDCRFSELADTLYNDSYDVISEYFDNSLYSEVFEINDSEVFFESVGCGQHDTRKELKDLFVSESLYNYIHELWDTYHLKSIPLDKFNKLKSLIESDSISDESEFIETWLTNHLN